MRLFKHFSNTHKCSCDKKNHFNIAHIGLNIKLTEGVSTENTNHPGVTIAMNQSPNVTTSNTKVAISLPDLAIIDV